MADILITPMFFAIVFLSGYEPKDDE